MLTAERGQLKFFGRFNLEHHDAEITNTEFQDFFEELDDKSCKIASFYFHKGKFEKQKSLKQKRENTISC